MKRRLCLLLFLAATACTGFGSGLIIIHDEDFWRYPPPILPPYPPPPRPIPPPHLRPPEPVWAPLELNFHQVKVRINDQLATTTIEQEFYNPNSRQLEGTFLFPVPKGAVLNKFSMEINGKPAEAELLSAEKARGLFEEVVRKLKDPALLEYGGREVYKVRIFPIEPNSKKRVTLGYTQVLKSDNGLVGFTLPLGGDKYSAKPLKTLSLKIDLETTRPLKSIYSPSHKVEIRRQGNNHAIVGYEATEQKPEGDFQLFYSQESGDLGVNLLTWKPDNEDGYFILLASPGTEAKRAKPNPKDITFVLDTSGSMAGNKLEQAKKALLFCVDNLNSDDRFEVIRFSTETESVFDKLVQATDQNRTRAREFIKDLKPIGGTAIDDALRKALAIRPATQDRPYVVIFLTDGQPTVGLTDETQIVESVAKSNNANTRIFCFGIGTDVNTHLLDKITEETKAISQYVLPEEDIEVKVSNFYTKIKEPVLAAPKVSFPEGAHVTKLYPSRIPDLFRGEQLVLVGRYTGSLDGTTQVEGTVNGEAKKFSYETKASGNSFGNDFIPRLWATRRVGYLLDEIRLRGESKELKDEVSDLARKYNIVTPYTAYLIMEDEAHRQVPTAMQSLQFKNQKMANSELRSDYYSFIREKDGDRAVAGARSAYDLKAAQSATEATVLGREEAFRGRLSASASAPTSLNPPDSMIPNGNGSAAGYSTSSGSKEVQRRSAELGSQSRFIQGRTFFRSDAQWIDSLVQMNQQASRIRVRFDSDEYFAFVRQHPEAAAWLSLGRNLQFFLGGTIYEICGEN